MKTRQGSYNSKRGFDLSKLCTVSFPTRIKSKLSYRMKRNALLRAQQGV